MLCHERAEGRDRARLGHGVGVDGEDRLADRALDAQIEVGGEPERPLVAQRSDAGRCRAGDVRNHEQLVDLRRERGQRLRELGGVPVRDDDRGHLHAARTCRYTAAVLRAVSSQEKCFARSMPAADNRSRSASARCAAAP